jgi:hypothetical protein
MKFDHLEKLITMLVYGENTFFIIYFFILDCPNGSFGHKCETVCDSNHYGMLCQSICDCKSNEKLQIKEMVHTMSNTPISCITSKIQKHVSI